MTKNNISQRKYEKFVEMTKAQETVNKIKAELKLTEYMYNKYFYTYINSNKKDEVKKVKAERVNRQSGMSNWLNAKLGVR